MLKRHSCERPDKMQKDQSRCSRKITSPESVTTYWRGGGVTRSTKDALKTGAVQLFGDFNVWRQEAIKIYPTFYDTSISPGRHVCNAIQMGAMMIRFGWGFNTAGRMEDGDDGGPPDRLLQAVCCAMSCCFISYFVDVIRRTNTICTWQGGLKVIPISEIA